MKTSAHTALLFTLLFTAPLAAQSVPFDICAESATWIRPTPEVQAKIWNQGRYSGSGPTDYYWTHNFIVLDDPVSASGFDHLHNLTGLWTAVSSFANVMREQNQIRTNGSSYGYCSIVSRKSPMSRTPTRSRLSLPAEDSK